MSPSKDWDAAVREAQGEPIRFSLGGTVFDVPTPIPAHVFLGFADKQVTGGGTDLVAAFRDLLLDMLEPSQREALPAAVRASGISGQMLIDLARWLIEEATARPTERLPTSPASLSANGAATSSAASPSRPGSRRQRTRSG